MTNPNIPPEIADATPATAPVRISPEVRETILGILRPRAESERRWATSINPHFDDYRTAWKKVNDVDAAIAFVEALP